MGGRVHGMAQLGGLEGFVKGFGAEGSAMACATGGFIQFLICSLMGKFGGEKTGSLPIRMYLSSDQNFPPSTHFPSGINLQCLAANLAVAFPRMSWRAELA